MRMDQFAGLTVAAEKFLKENQRPPRVCPTCGHITETYIEKIGTFKGAFDTEYQLNRYPLKKGYADEFLQTAPWSSGPVHFLGLRVGEIEFTWSEEEIEGWLNT